MKKRLLMFAPVLMSFATVPTGYEHWTTEQFRAREQALHKAMKEGLASETLGTWGKSPAPENTPRSEQRPRGVA